MNPSIEFNRRNIVVFRADEVSIKVDNSSMINLEEVASNVVSMLIRNKGISDIRFMSPGDIEYKNLKDVINRIFNWEEFAYILGRGYVTECFGCIVDFHILYENMIYDNPFREEIALISYLTEKYPLTNFGLGICINMEDFDTIAYDDFADCLQSLDYFTKNNFCNYIADCTVFVKTEEHLEKWKTFIQDNSSDTEPLNWISDKYIYPVSSNIGSCLFNYPIPVDMDSTLFNKTLETCKNNIGWNCCIM